jgi:hypothetical protein
MLGQLSGATALINESLPVMERHLVAMRSHFIRPYIDWEVQCVEFSELKRNGLNNQYVCVI